LGTSYIPPTCPWEIDHFFAANGVHFRFYPLCCLPNI